MNRNLNLTLPLLIILSAATALGQVTGGSVTGTVLDPNGGVVPNATIVLNNKATGQALTVQTTGSGAYSFPNVAVGEYTLTAEAPGFGRVTLDLKVALNQTTSLDVTLAAAGVQETVSVAATSEALVQSETSQLGQSFETRLVHNLPIFGAQNQLALLSPNVVARGSGTLGAGGSVGGTRARSNVFTIDGVDNNDPGVTGPAVAVIQDSVAEFTLLSNNFNAEFGGGGGGQFVTITKSGTNELHGSGFYYVQSERFNAASTSEEQQLKDGEITELPRYRDARFGFTVGGPILKNNLFFFGAYEREINREAGGADSFLSPTAAGFQQIAGLPGASPFVIDLLRNNLTFAGSQSTTQTVLGTPGIPFGVVTVNVPVGFDQDLAQINIDHQPTSRDQFRYRFNYNKISQEQAGGGNTKFNNLVVGDSKFFAATWVRTLTPSLVNDLRLTYRYVSTDWPLKDPALVTFPNVQILPLGLNLGPAGNLPQSGSDNVYQAFDTVSYLRGEHAFKFGGEYRRILSTQDFLPRARGDYLYSTLDDLLRDLTPAGRDALRGVGSGAFTGNVTKFAFFAQDDWKLTPHLTLNLGLRYEYSGVPRDVRSVTLNSIANVPGVITFDVPEADRNNFAPRLGFAYSPDFGGGLLGKLFGGRGRSAIRGNVSVAYSDVFQNLVSIQLPPQLQQEMTVGIAAAQFGFDTDPGFLQRGGLPSIPVPPATTAAARGATAGVIKELTNSYTLAYTLSVQRELTPTMAVEVRYLGTRSYLLPVQAQVNAAAVNPTVNIPTFFSVPAPAQLAGLATLGSILARPGVGVGPLDRYGFPRGVTEFQPVGSAQYDAGSVSVTRRFSRGLAFTAAYTFSKTIDNSTNELNSSAVNPRRPEDTYNLSNERGLSANDIPHRFVFAGNYELPFFRRSDSRFLRTALGGFELAAIFQAQSGQPVTPRSSVDSNLNGDSAGDRAIFNENGVPGTASRVCSVNAAGQLLTSGGATTTTSGGVTVPVNFQTCGQGAGATVAYVAVNPNAQFIQAGLGARTNSGRNVLRTSGFNRTDMTLLKNFRFGGEERFNLQVGAEVFNLFNQRIRTLGTAPNGSFNNGSASGPRASGVNVQSAFANVNSALFNDYSAGIYSGRTVQLRAKFIF